MNEQRPPSSPPPHPAGQPQQRSMPVQPHAPHAPHVNHAHAPHLAPHGPQAGARPLPAAAATASLPVDDDLVTLDDDAIALEDDGQATPPSAAPAGSASAAHPAAPVPKKITFSADGYSGKQRTWKRKPHLSGTGACRVKTFHGKCSDQGLEYLDDAINAFLDDHPDIEVKLVQSNIGMFDGKFKDFALIVNVWY